MPRETPTAGGAPALDYGAAPRVVAAAPAESARQRGASGPRAVARVVRGAVLLVVFAIALELTCRVEDRLRYGTPLLSRVTSHADLIVRDADGAHGRPNARYQQWVLNALGMRGPAAAAAKPAGTLRIVAVGASETMGLYESRGREFPRQLEDSLRLLLDAGTCGGAPPARVEVLNAALPGMSLPTVVQDVRNRLRRFAPDVVLLYPTPVQYVDDAPPVAAPPDSSGRTAALPVSRVLRPRVLWRFREQAKMILPEAVKSWLRRRETRAAVRARPAEWRFTSAPPERLALYDEELRRLVGAVRGIGAEPVLATHANAFMRPDGGDTHLLASWERFYPRATGATLIAFDAAARLVTLRAAADSGVAAVDVARRMAAAPASAFSDFVHFTDSGAAMVAGELSRGLIPALRARGMCGAP